MSHKHFTTGKPCDCTWNKHEQEGGINWAEVGDRPHIPSMDDQPNQVTVVRPLHWDKISDQDAKKRRTPFWLLRNPQAENEWHVTLGHPGMEHQDIAEAHDSKYNSWHDYASGAYKPAGYSEMGWSNRTFDNPTVQFFNTWFSPNTYDEYDDDYPEDPKQIEGDRLHNEIWPKVEQAVHGHFGTTPTPQLPVTPNDIWEDSEPE